MSSKTPPLRRLPLFRGFTLVEITLVIAVVLMMISVLFLGVNAYKKGSDRAICIQNIASVQKAVRSYSNLSALGPGETVANLKDQIIGPDRFIESDPVCPADGVYTYGGDVIPLAGAVYLSCNLSEHLPTSPQSW